MALGEIKDSDWVRQSMLLPTRGGRSTARTADIVRVQQYSSGSLVFADTSLGGNRSINPRPQFTKQADPNLNSLLTDNTGLGAANHTTSMGMGQYYAEAVEAQAERIYMQAGIPAFNSLSNVFSMFYDPEIATLANKGTVKSLLYSVGKYASYMVFWEVHAALSVGRLLNKAVASTVSAPLSKFYYMRSSMPLYWSAVTVITNAVMVNMGLAQPTGNEPGDNATGGPSEFGGNLNDAETMHKLLPLIMRGNTGGIDIRAVATRYQVLADAHAEALEKIASSYTDSADLQAKLEAHYNRDPSSYVETGRALSTKEYMELYKKSAAAEASDLDPELPQAAFEPKDTEAGGASTADTAATSAYARAYAERNETSNLFTGVWDHLTKFKSFVDAERHGGSDFVSFIVNPVEGVTESWSNTTRTSSIADTMNQTSSENRSRLFNIAGGNIGDNPVINTIEAIAGGVKDIISGGLESFGIAGLEAVGGAAFIDMPEYWQDAVTQMPSNSYTIDLSTPYGNSVSVVNNIIVPIAMLLPFAAPRSAGSNAYTAPFLCKLWHQGISVVDLGMVTAMSITRSIGSVGRNVNSQSVAVTVTFTVTNLSKMMHMPISNETPLSDALRLSLLDEPNNFSNYMGVLAGLSMNDYVYASNRMRLQMAKAAQNFDSWLSSANIAQGLIDTLPGALIKSLSSQSAT